MPYPDYTDLTWKVFEAEPDSKCQPGTLIRFGGPPDEVTIRCDGQTPYLKGVYHKDTHTIERENDYKIEMSETKPPTITFTLYRSTDWAGGSWTADDNIPGPGDG